MIPSQLNATSAKKVSIGASLIRERLFPELKSLREYANKLIHHLDDPENRGVAGLNIQGVFSYCITCSEKILMPSLA